VAPPYGRARGGSGGEGGWVWADTAGTRTRAASESGPSRGRSLCAVRPCACGERREGRLLCFASVRGSLSCDFGPDPWTNWCGARAYGGIRAGPVAGQRAPPV
jgi:hypothetical protein